MLATSNQQPGIAMNRIREYRKAQGWTLQKLADASGTTKSQIDKLEKGFRRLTVDWMVRLAKPLKCDPRDLMGDFAPAPKGGAFEPIKFSSSKTGPKDGLIPVRAFAPARIKLATNPIDHLPRPYFLAHVQDAYALFVLNDAMSPMYRARQMLFINPHKTPSAGAGVVVTDKKDGVLIREFVKQTPKGIVLREYKPKQRDITVTDVAAVHVVVGAVEG